MNKELDKIKDFSFCFRCRQNNLKKDFYFYYEKMIKYERMKCLLCVSGLKKITLGE